MRPRRGQANICKWRKPSASRRLCYHRCNSGPGEAAMANGQLATAIVQMRRLIGRKSGCTLTDGQLVEAFVRRRDEASLEVLVWRHGTTVLSLCQRMPRDSHAAEDAVQATFLI